jgi:hypothetical protein
VTITRPGWLNTRGSRFSGVGERRKCGHNRREAGIITNRISVLYSKPE